MNIGTHFEHSNHIAFISTHTKIGTSHEQAPVSCANRSEFANSAFLNAVANFRQCLAPIVSKLLTWDTNQNLGKAS